MNDTVVLKSLILESKDGEWGKSKPFEKSKGMLVIRGTDFLDVRVGKLENLPFRYIPSHIAYRKYLQPNDILIETAGGSGNRPTGRTLFIKKEIIQKLSHPVTCASFSRFIRINSQKANPNFIFWYLQHMYAYGSMWQYNTRHTGVARFQYTIFSETEPFILPSLNIQNKIATILSSYDNLIENNIHRIKLLEEMAKAMFQEWFVHYRYPGYEKVRMVDSNIEFGKIPEEWELCKLIDFVSFERGIEPGSRNYLDSPRENAVPFLRVGDLNKRDSSVYIIAELSKNKYIRENDIVISLDGTVGIVRIGLSGCYSTGIRKIIFRNSERIGWAYTYLLLQSKQIQDVIHAHARGTTILHSGTALDQLLLLLPPQNIMNRFEELVSPMLYMILILEKKNNCLQQTRDYLLPRLISGELDVSELNIQIK